jgi:predicted nucleic acid-binding Zn ribbon protein
VDSAKQDNTSDEKSQAFRTFEERMEKRRRRASVSRLIFYVVALILVIILMLWFRSRGM